MAIPENQEKCLEKPGCFATRQESRNRNFKPQPVCRIEVNLQFDPIVSGAETREGDRHGYEVEII